MDVPADLRITITDVRRAGYCVGPAGAKGWFAEQGLDFRDFLKNGIDAQAFLATGDGHAERVVALKLGQRPHG